MELYNISTDIYKLKNTVSQLNTQEAMDLQDFVVTLSKCAGSKCYGMKQILNNIINIPNKNGTIQQCQIPCHNPSDFAPDYSIDIVIRYIDDLL